MRRRLKPRSPFATECEQLSKEITLTIRLLCGLSITLPEFRLRRFEQRVRLLSLQQELFCRDAKVRAWAILRRKVAALDRRSKSPCVETRMNRAFHDAVQLSLARSWNDGGQNARI